ncbi:hypothetical protein [Gracilinema caldarium]|uniref:hypothetical protein n=1 Tax=Gracilinema caldarium TaxID=215591 RepID=UPI0026E95BDD|nr:hypothetical protein [Gracilinema caldarium]
MRTTITLPDDIMHSIYSIADEEKKSVKEVFTELLTIALHKKNPERGTWNCPAYDMGGAAFDYTKAWQLIDNLESDAVAEKRDMRK